MNGSKEIIVVSPKQYTDLARKLAHDISKIPRCNGAFWSLKQFTDNEFQLGGNRYAIFIGDQDENALTKSFFTVFAKVHNRAGACCAFDAAKAVVYGEGKLEQAKDFQELLQEIVSSNNDKVGIGAGIASLIVFTPIAWILLPPTIFLFTWLKRKKKARELKEQQTKAALALFLSKHFDKWIGVER